MEGNWRGAKGNLLELDWNGNVGCCSGCLFLGSSLTGTAVPVVRAFGCLDRDISLETVVGVCSLVKLAVAGVGEAASVEVGVVDSTGKVVSRGTNTGTVFWDVNTGAAGADGAEGTGDGGVPGDGGTGVGKNVGCMGDKRGDREGTVWPKLVLRRLAGLSFLFPIWKN